jgi:hypothetical protein
VTDTSVRRSQVRTVQTPITEASAFACPKSTDGRRFAYADGRRPAGEPTHNTAHAGSPRVPSRCRLPSSIIRQQWGAAGRYLGISTDEKVKRRVVVSGVEQATSDGQS